MHEYDIALKSILARLPGSVLAELTGFAVERWHNVELPDVRNLHVDMLGETGRGDLVHIELQSTNQAGMVFRMLEYAIAIQRGFRRFPQQLVLYVGNAPLRMPSRVTAPGLTFEYRLVDIRNLDGEALLASHRLDDNVIAVLMRLGNERQAVKRILGRIAAAKPDEGGVALAKLMILGGLRKLGAVIEQEIEQMPILDDIMDHEVLGRERKRGIALGREEGRAEGELLGQRLVIVRQAGKRFGQVPEWARQRIDTLSGSELEQVELRLLDAKSLEELLG